MNREEFQQQFDEKARPWLKRAGELAGKFQQWTCDALIRRWLFWPLMGLAATGLVTIVWWAV